MSIIHLINLISVGVFGMILSASFCDILWAPKKRLIMAGSMTAILMLQGLVYFSADLDTVEYIYPLITHLPLIVVLCFLSKKCLWSVISVLTAYLCCQIRRWLALLAAAVFSGGAVMQDTVELILTVPILLAILRFIAPSVRPVAHYTVTVQWQFGMVPMLYYGFDYLTSIYTKLLLEGVLVAVEFMPFVCSLVYLIFVVRISEDRRIRSRLEQTQEVLNLQIAQAVREIRALRESQQKTRIYRHDLRHHMQYLSACIENGRFEQAQGYIHEVCLETETDTVTPLCENEVANLVLSAFAGKAKEYGIPIKIKARIPTVIHVSESDLCVLLSNAMENALHACQKRAEEGLSTMIEVSAYEEKGKFFLQFINSCDADIAFANGIPVTDNPGHGLGVRSICAIVERYGGIYTFSVKDGTFVLRVSL